MLKLKIIAAGAQWRPHAITTVRMWKQDGYVFQAHLGYKNVILLAKAGDLPEHRNAKASLDNTVRSHLKENKRKIHFFKNWSQWKYMLTLTDDQAWPQTVNIGVLKSIIVWALWPTILLF